MPQLDGIGRRRFMQLVGLGGISATLAACARDDLTGRQMTGPLSGVTAGAPGPGSVTRGRRGGTVITAWSSAGNSYDAAIGYDLHSWDAITGLLYTPLYQYDGQYGGPRPSAAAAMPTISSDGTEYTIKLRPGVRFHNGRTVVAEDYIYAWTRVLNPKTQSWAQSYLLSIDGADAVAMGKSRTVSGLTAVDSTTLRVRLTGPDITFQSVMCLPFTAALPREEVERPGANFNHQPVGNGPFKIISYDEAGQSARFVANPDYFWKDTPYLGAVHYRWGLDPATQLLQLKNGNVDILGEGLAGSSAVQVQGNTSLRDQVLVTVPVNATYFIAPNYKRRELRDVRVRQALNFATDRTQLAKFTYGGSSPWGCAFPEREPNFPRTAKPYEYNLDKARALMSAAGVKSLDLEFINGGDDIWPAASQVLQQQWQAIGVHLNLLSMSASAFQSAISAQQADIYGTHWFQVLPSALDLVGSNFVTGASSNYNRYSNKRVDALAKKAQAASTVSASNTILAQIENVLGEDAAAVFVSNIDFLGARAPRIQNVHYRCEMSFYYDRMWV